MKHLQDNIPPTGGTTPSDVIRWHTSLQVLHARLASHFARPEPYARALRFVQGILSTLERKNGWQLAEQAREATPYGMQRLLSQAVWDADGVRDEIRAFALQQVGSRHVIAAIDESGFLKRGTHSAGVGKQHYGPTGDLRNCQVGVFLSLVTEASHTLIDRELYLPADWTDDPVRCQRAAIPATVPFRTKPQLAILMLERLEQAHVSMEWVVADSVYGGNPDLRTWLEAHKQPYVMAIACDEPVVLEIPQVGVRRLEVRDVPAQLSPSDWQQLSMSEAPKGLVSLPGPVCPFGVKAAMMVGRACCCVAPWTRPRSWRFIWSLRPLARSFRPRSQHWEAAGVSKRTLRMAKISAWTTTKCAASSAGIAIMWNTPAIL